MATRAPIMANRILALVRKMFNFAIEHEWLETNPCAFSKRGGRVLVIHRGCSRAAAKTGRTSRTPEGSIGSICPKYV